MVGYVSGIDKKDVRCKTHALIFLGKLSMVRNVFLVIKGLCVSVFFVDFIFKGSCVGEIQSI